MEPVASIDFVVMRASRRPEIVIVPEPDAQFLAGALNGLAPDADLPNARSIAVRIETALKSDTELLELAPHQVRELLCALDRIAGELPRVLSPDLVRLRDALADSAIASCGHRSDTESTWSGDADERT
jgi:hypothetical protein